MTGTRYRDVTANRQPASSATAADWPAAGSSVGRCTFVCTSPTLAAVAPTSTTADRRSMGRSFCRRGNVIW